MNKKTHQDDFYTELFIVKNHPPDQQQSIIRFGDALQRVLNKSGINIRTWEPPALLGRWSGSQRARIFQMPGYIDNFFRKFMCSKFSRGVDEENDLKKVVLVSNYSPDMQQSMLRFGAALKNTMSPNALIHIWSPPNLLGKWSGSQNARFYQALGYFDKFILGFLSLLWFRLQNPRCIWHIIDHGNSGYIFMLPRKKSVITVHDCLALNAARNGNTRFTGRIFQFWIAASLRRAARLCSVSNETARQLHAFQIDPERIVVIPNALNHPYLQISPPETQERLHKANIPSDRPFLFHIGSNSWYKNRLGVIDIFNAFRRQNPDLTWRLVLAGQSWSDDLRRAVNASPFRRDIHDAGTIDNDTLEACYNGCACFIFPSLAEGFGWPIAEAQACGAVVVTSNRAPMPEVGGDDAWYADPTNPDEFAKMIQTAFANKSEKSPLRNAQRFQTDQWRDAHLRVYQSLITDSIRP